LLLREAPVDAVLDFLAQFRNHPLSGLTEGGPVRRYIQERQDTELAAWDILFTSLQKETGNIDDSLGAPIVPQMRTAGDGSTTDTLYIIKQRVSSRGVEKAGLSKLKIAEAEEEYRHELEAQGNDPDEKKSINYPDRIYRAKREKPLLIVHLLKIQQGKSKYVPQKEAVVAWSISFPRTATEEKRVEYVVNTTWLRESYREELDEEEMGGDEE
jgi:hypothetical protein